MGRHHNRARCHITCSCQLALSVCPFALPFLTGGGCKPYSASIKRKYKKEEAKRDREDDSFVVGLLPYLGNVCVIKDVSG